MNLHQDMRELRELHEETAAIKSKAAAEGRSCTHEENEAFNAKAGRMLLLQTSIEETKGKNTILKLFNSDGIPKWIHDPEARSHAEGIRQTGRGTLASAIQ